MNEEIDYISIRQHPDGDFEAIAVYFDETDEPIYRYGGSVKDCREYCKEYYPGITIQRD